MPGKFLKIISSQVAALAIATPMAAQSEAPAALFGKGPGFQERVEQRLTDHEQRLTRLEVVSAPRQTSGVSGGKTPVPTTTARPASTRTMAKTKRPAAGQAGSVAATPKTHAVRAGETPSAIARKYGVSVARLLEANGLASGSVIRPGQKLVLPGAGKAKPSAHPPVVAGPAPSSKAAVAPAKDPGGMGRHTVQRGETVRALASRFGIAEKEFMRLNGLKDATRLRAGAVVKYPLAATAAGTAEAFARGEGETAVAPLPTGWSWHTVERGESLSQVAARYGHDRSSLERANALQPGAAIHEGLKLKVPPPGVTLEPPATEAQRAPEGEDHPVLAYQVQKGETLEGLAQTFATTPDTLRALNRLAPGETLVSGRRIVVPNNLFE